MGERPFDGLRVPVFTLFGFCALRVEGLGNGAKRFSTQTEPVHFGDDPLLRKVGYEFAVLFFPPKRQSASEISRPLRFEFRDTRIL